MKKILTTSDSVASDFLNLNFRRCKIKHWRNISLLIKIEDAREITKYVGEINIALVLSNNHELFKVNRNKESDSKMRY